MNPDLDFFSNFQNFFPVDIEFTIKKELSVQF